MTTLHGNAKVDDLDGSIHNNEIGGLEVSMHHFVLMDTLHTQAVSNIPLKSRSVQKPEIRIPLTIVFDAL